MNINKIPKLKKYLFLISIIFLVSTLSHLLYNFLYSDSKLVPIKGGTIAEGIVGDFPSLNPLKPLYGNNKYIINLLYRSLLTYDIKENKISSDIASCDISNLLYVECFIKDNSLWSDGSTITAQDVLETYQLLQNTDVNPIFKKILSETIIEKKDNIITFRNKNKDVNFINILFQPILSKDIINRLSNEQIYGNFEIYDQKYSGNFKIKNIESNSSIGVTNINLINNDIYGNTNITNFQIKLFPDINTLLKNKETINIFNDTNNLIGNSIPRFENFKYTLPQYVSLYLNKENIKNQNLRNFILNKIERKNLITLLGEDNFQEVKNPYLTNTNIDNKIDNKNIEQIFKDLGYLKKSKIIDKILPNKNNKKYSNEAKIIKEEDIEKQLNGTKFTIDKFQKNSITIVSPEYVDKYNFVSKDDILLKGKVDEGTKEVYINNYKIKSFKEGDKYFYYKLKESYNTLKEGNNVYNIYFTDSNNKKIKIEEINFLYYKNKTKRLKEIEKFIKQLYIDEIKKNNQEEKNKKIDIIINKEEFTSISNLDDNFYYNKNLEIFTLKLAYIGNDNALEQTINFIEHSLEETGIKIKIYKISNGDIKSLLDNKDNYDMILTGINLGYFDFNIFPFFHSGQVNNGKKGNFSQIRKKTLDMLLEDLKSDISNINKIEENKQKVLEILKNEQIIKTLYTPKINLLIDKNIKNILQINKLPDDSIRYKILINSYINEFKIIDFSNKSISTFFKFLFNKINE